MARVRLDLSLPDPKTFRTALAEATRQGLDVCRAFEDLGLASGFIDPKSIDALLQIDGIASVKPDNTKAPKAGPATVLGFASPRPR